MTSLKASKATFIALAEQVVLSVQEKLSRSSPKMTLRTYEGELTASLTRICVYNVDIHSHNRSIVNVMRNSGCDVPEWMLSLKAPSQNAKKQLRRKPVERKDVSRAVGSIGEKRKSSHKASRKAKKSKSDVRNGSESPSDMSGED